MADKEVFPSYPGLARVPAVLGVPLMPALVAMVFGLLLSLVGGITLGPGGLLLGAVVVPVLVYFREMCSTDDQALRILWLELLCIMRRRHYVAFGKTLTLAPISYGKNLSTYMRAHLEIGTHTNEAE
jgi:type IV secretion system protein VirB3